MNLSFLTTPTAQTVETTWICMLVASAFVQSLPTPAEIPGVWYKALYNFLNVIVQDLKSFVKTPTFATTTSRCAVTTVLPSGSIETVNTDATATSTSGSATTPKTGV